MTILLMVMVVAILLGWLAFGVISISQVLSRDLYEQKEGWMGLAVIGWLFFIMVLI